MTEKKPMMLMCRTEDDSGSGGWIMVEVDDVADGDRVARALQAQLTDLNPLRCELAVNADAGLKAWAKKSVKRKQARARALGRASS